MADLDEWTTAWRDAAPVLERLRYLIARAVHPGTPAEEARTSAVLACQLIERHGFDVGPNGWRTMLEPTKPVDTPVPAVRWREIRSRYPGRCARCGRRYHKSELIAWRPGYACHANCITPEEWRAGAAA